MTLPKETPFTRLPRWIRWPLILWLVLGLFPVLSEAFGFHFMPSPEWMDHARILAALSGIAMAILLAVAVVIGINISSRKMGNIKKFAVILFTPVMGLFMGSFAVSSALPMIAAMATGGDAELRYSVTKVTERNSRRCGNPITLEGMPWVANKLCWFPADFRNTFARGDVIVVTGRGTLWGVFPHEARRAD